MAETLRIRDERALHGWRTWVEHADGRIALAPCFTCLVGAVWLGTWLLVVMLVGVTLLVVMLGVFVVFMLRDELRR